jgi:hypothetical protein
LLSPNDPGKTDTAHATAENNTGFTFSHVPPGTHTGSFTSALPVASVQDNKQSSASTSIFGLKQSSTSDVETSTAADVKNKAGLFQRLFFWHLFFLFLTTQTIRSIAVVIVLKMIK